MDGEDDDALGVAFDSMPSGSDRFNCDAVSRVARGELLVMKNRFPEAVGFLKGTEKVS